MSFVIEYVSKKDLQPYVNNAKIHTEEQIGQIRKSIEQFGFNDPIAVWKNNIIIEGHGRLMAVLDMDIEEVPIIRLDHLTEQQRIAYTIIHNKIATSTGLNIQKLEEELMKIDDIDMTVYDFQSLEQAEEDLEGFFQNQETGKKNQTEQESEITFIIKAEGEQRDILVDYLEQEGYDYEER